MISSASNSPTGLWKTSLAELRRIEPPAFPDIETIGLEEGNGVIVLRVPGGGGPYTYDGRPYIRNGPTTGVMPRAEYGRQLSATAANIGEMLLIF